MIRGQIFVTCLNYNFVFKINLSKVFIRNLSRRALWVLTQTGWRILPYFQLYPNWGQLKLNEFTLLHFTPILPWSRAISQSFDDINPRNKLNYAFSLRFLKYFTRILSCTNHRTKNNENRQRECTNARAKWPQRRCLQTH